MNLVAIAIEHFECRKCGAKRRQGCRTRTGNRYLGTWYVHDARLEVLLRVRRDGIDMGRRLATAAGRKRLVIRRSA